MTTDEKVFVGRTVKVLREASNLTQAELGRACGVTRQRIHDIETGTKAIGERLAGVIAAIIAPKIRASERDLRRLLSPGEGE